MDKIIEKTEAFLNSWHLGPDSIDMDQYCSQFLQEMDAGLAGKNSSLAMIPSYTTTEVSIQPGSSVIVLDAGGTNFRTCLVTFDEELVPHISHFKKCGMPGVKHETSAQEFFKILANEVEP
ncbi:MAG: hexokinase, partial [Sphaerochaetaceae bacterium]|nr:hexokinase [Sphaerochaetaceae bacterium]